MTLIMCDIDSTLYDSDLLFNEVAKEFNIHWPIEYSFWFGPGYINTDLNTIKKIFRRAHSKEYVMKNEPYTDAAGVLRGLIEDYDNIEIAYVSDRNEQQLQALKDWLEQEGFLISEDQCVIATKDKRHWMRVARPEIVIDDRVRTLLMARYELGSQAIGLEYPYNINLTGEVDGLYIVKSWLQIEDLLKDKIMPLILGER